jgi:hypothetical protein
MTQATPINGQLLVESKAGLKAAVLAVVIGLLSIGLFVLAVGLIVEDPANLTKALISVGAGALLGLWCVFEARAFLFVERYYTDRAERMRGAEVKALVKFTDAFTFTYAFRSDGSEHHLTIAGPKGKFTLMTTLAPGQAPTSQEPSVEQIEALCSHLAQVVANQIEQAVSRASPFRIDRAWVITASGVEIDGQRVAWSELNVEPDDSAGVVTFQRRNTRVARRSMTAENVLGALAFLRTREAPTGKTLAA